MTLTSIFFNFENYYVRFGFDSFSFFECYVIVFLVTKDTSRDFVLEDVDHVRL